ncbi:MAG TPA: FGGY family carbohydrate kinase [Acidimicrobiia bacterium]
MPLVLGVHSSIDATIVQVRDADDGYIVGSGRVPHPVAKSSQIEQLPADWWEALVAARREAGASPVGAVAVVAQSHGLVALDANGAVIRAPRIGPDPDAAADAEWLISKAGGPEGWAKACGTVPNAALAIAKLSWLRRVKPDAFNRIAHLLCPHDWMTSRLARRYVTDRGDASTTGYWSPREECWQLDLLALVDDADWAPRLPHVLGAGEPAAARDGVIVAPGTGELMAAALALGAERGEVIIDVGTTGRVFTVSEQPTADVSGNVAGCADAAGGYLPVVSTGAAAAVTDAVALLLGIDPARLDRLALDAPPGAAGVVLDPTGESSRDDGDAIGSFVGLHTGVTPEHIARAAVESVARRALEGIEQLRSAGVTISEERVTLMGRGARSHALQRVVADLAQVPVRVMGPQQAVIGACVQAAAMVHGVPAGEVAHAWGLSDGRALTPDAHADAEQADDDPTELQETA